VDLKPELLMVVQLLQTLMIEALQK